MQRDHAVATFSINDAPRNRMIPKFMDALEAEVTGHPGPRHRVGGTTPQQGTGAAKRRSVRGGEQ